MPTELLILGLILMTFVAVLVFLARSKKRTETELHDDKAPKSALAKDGPTGNVEDRR